MDDYTKDYHNMLALLGSILKGAAHNTKSVNAILVLLFGSISESIAEKINARPSIGFHELLGLVAEALKQNENQIQDILKQQSQIIEQNITIH